MALVGVVPQYPVVTYDSTGQINYNALSQAFDLVAAPLAFRETSSSVPRVVSAPRGFEIHIQVDNAGKLVGGAAGPDLVLSGVVDVNGDGSPDLSGVLLTGEATQFGYLDVGVTDRYDFRFTVTGGALQPYFLGKDIAVATTSENSTFTGSFAADFHGHAKGNLGTTRRGCVIGPDKSVGSEPYVSVIDEYSGKVVRKFLAYEKGYRGGVRVATGDLTGDGVDEIVTAPGRSHKPEIRVFQLDGTELTQFRFLAYAANFTGGVNVAVGDVDGDGKNDIVTAPSYGASQVKVWRNLFDPAHPTADPIASAPYRSFLAFPAKFIGGATVQVADMGTFSNATAEEILVGNGAGMRSTINVFDAARAVPRVVRTFFPFESTFRGGVSFDVMKANGDDNVPDLFVGTGNAGKSRVQVLDGLSGAVLSSFTAYTDRSCDCPAPRRRDRRQRRRHRRLYRHGPGHRRQVEAAQAVHVVRRAGRRHHGRRSVVLRHVQPRLPARLTRITSGPPCPR